MASPAPDATAEAAPSLWREALSGEHRDYTHGPIGRAIVLLAIPMVLEMVMESIFAVADVFYVSRLGADAVATVGLTEAMITIVYTVAMGLGIGVTATVARRIGEGHDDAAAHTAAQGILLGLAGAVLLGLVGWFGAPHLLRLMGASDAVLATGTTYARIMLGPGCMVVLELFLINAAFRGAGDAAIAMRVLWFANAINIALAPCLVFGLGPFPQLGVTGAAIATTIGRGCGVLFQLRALARRGGRLRLRREHWRPDPPLMAQLLGLSGAGMLQIFISTASWIGLARVIATFGTAATAGYTIAIRVVLFAIMPAFGLSNAAATMVGQSLGAQLPERAERSVWLACRYNLYFLGSIGLAFALGAHHIAGWFTSDPEVRRQAGTALRIVALGFPFYAYGMTLTQSFNGAGDTRTPTWLNLACFWAWEIPLAWGLAHGLGWGATGAFTAVAVAFSTLAVAAALLFRRGGWKTVRV